MKHTAIAVACCALLALAGCATQTAPTAARPQTGQHALVIFKITHQDRAGESGTTIRRTGEIVTVGADGWAVIAGSEGDILRVPAKALHRVTPAIAAILSTRKATAPDYVAGEELERWFPAQTVPFTVRWLAPEEIAAVLHASKPTH